MNTIRQYRKLDYREERIKRRASRGNWGIEDNWFAEKLAEVRAQKKLIARKIFGV